MVEVLRSGVLALGPRTERFEQLAAEAAGVQHGVAVSSGTAGLHLIVHGLGIGPGDEVLVPSFTFAASVNAILYEGATPVFVDIEPDSYNLDPAEIEAKEDAGHQGNYGRRRVRPPGRPRQDRAWHSDGLAVIDDCCEAIGATYRGRPVGGFGAAGCFAFYPNKQITTGEGGMIVTNDDELAATCRSLRNQGRAQMGSWLEHERLGFNYRMDELSAALGVSQIGRLTSFMERRANVARMYTERLGDLTWLRTPVVRDDVTMSWFVYVVTLAPDVQRDDVVDALASDGIPSRTYFPPMHLAPYVRERLGTREGMLPVTEDVARRTLALPFHNRMTEAQVDQVVGSLQRAVNGR